MQFWDLCPPSLPQLAQERERPGKAKNDESVKFCWKLKEDGGLKMFSGVNNMLPMDLDGAGNQIEG